MQDTTNKLGTSKASCKELFINPLLVQEFLNVNTSSLKVMGNNFVHNNIVFDGLNESVVSLDANSLDPKGHSTVIFKENNDSNPPKGNNKK